MFGNEKKEKIKIGRLVFPQRNERSACMSPRAACTAPIHVRTYRAQVRAIIKEEVINIHLGSLALNVKSMALCTPASAFFVVYTDMASGQHRRGGRVFEIKQYTLHYHYDLQKGCHCAPQQLVRSSSCTRAKSFGIVAYLHYLTLFRTVTRTVCLGRESWPPATGLDLLYVRSMLRI
jgi:hypothetical protein